MKTEYQYIRFVEQPNPGRKTRVWEIHNRHHGDLLGVVKWYPAWRQYCAEFEPNTVFSVGCLADVQQFISEAKRVPGWVHPLDPRSTTYVSEYVGRFRAALTALRRLTGGVAA